MRMLGTRSNLAVFRWDLLYLLAQTSADERPDVNALAPRVQTMIDDLTARRSEQEGAEDAAVITQALLRKKDSRRDDLLVEMGGVARATSKDVYAAMFAKRNPSLTARLPVKEESAEIKRILGELSALPAGHPLRAAYEKTITDAETAVATASDKNDASLTALALQRSQSDRLKLSLDKGRLEIHGVLLSVVKDKEEADAFFRPTAAAPGDEARTDTADPAPPA